MGNGVNGTKKQISSYLVQLGVGLEESARWWCIALLLECYVWVECGTMTAWSNGLGSPGYCSGMSLPAWWRV